MPAAYPSPAKTSTTPVIIGLAFAAAAVILLLTGCGTVGQPVATVPHVNLTRYVGKWYEIAAYPAWFERKCAGDVTAKYTARPDGTILVVNRCRTRAGDFTESAGRAKVVPGSANAKLKVSFGVPFITGDYWVIGLDGKKYRWALVGDPSRKYLWILAREPHISDALYREIVGIAVARGYDPAKLRRTAQHP